jgi:pimeloyl-ACP methyl ester carboxylesterase
MRRLFAWTVATPGGLLIGRWTAKLVFAPEPAPADFGPAGGGLLPLRPRNLYASSSELMASLAFGTGPSAMTSRYSLLNVPVGILFGRDDHVLDWREQGQSVKEKLPSLDLELVRGGHMLPVTQPEVCATFIRRIAAKVPVRDRAAV